MKMKDKIKNILDTLNYREQEEIFNTLKLKATASTKILSDKSYWKWFYSFMNSQDNNYFCKINHTQIDNKKTKKKDLNKELLHNGEFLYFLLSVAEFQEQTDAHLEYSFGDAIYFRYEHKYYTYSIVTVGDKTIIKIVDLTDIEDIVNNKFVDLNLFFQPKMIITTEDLEYDEEQEWFKNYANLIGLSFLFFIFYAIAYHIFVIRGVF